MKWLGFAAASAVLTAYAGAASAQDAAAGEHVFIKCKACHQIGEGAHNMVGPSLNGIVGRHPELTNLLFANGFSGHGMQQSPAVGRGVAELLCFGEYRSLDLSDFRFERLIDSIDPRGEGHGWSWVKWSVRGSLRSG